MMAGSGAKSARHAFTAALLEAAGADRRIVAVTSDAKGSVTLGDFEKALPRQFLEMGIAEQNTVGVSAGLARSGKKPFVCGPACFYTARAIEQVKNDVAYAGSDVKIVGVSGGVSYGALGSTHHSLHDLAFLRAIPGIAVILPCDNAQTRAATLFLARYDGPAYMRLGRGPVPDVYPAGSECFDFGRARRLRDGADCTIVSAGEALFHALKAAEELEAGGLHARVLDMATIKPLDEEAVREAARETGAIVTVEEHGVHGGLGSAVAEVVAQSHPVPMRIIGFPDEFPPAGSSAELFDYYGITGPAIAAAVRDLLGTHGR
ncbi:MAG TPA: transketolase C-terminal domain-containing protein [Spirochaetia bacterium]